MADITTKSAICGIGIEKAIPEFSTNLKVKKSVIFRGIFRLCTAQYLEYWSIPTKIASQKSFFNGEIIVVLENPAK